MAKHQQILTWILYAALAALAGFLLFRFILPWTLPFLLALLTARLVEPGVRLLIERLNLRRGFAATVCSLLVLALMLTAVGFAIQQLINGVTGFVQQLPEMAGQMGHTFSRLESAVYRFIIAAPVETQAMFAAAVESVAALLEELPAELSTRVFSFAATIAAAFPRIFLFTITYAISVFFISAAYPQVTAFLLRQIPAKWHQRVRNLREDLSQTLVKWCKAQIMLIGVTFAILTAAFLILRVSYGILFDALIAVIDALPILGTGTVLIPWAILRMLGGDFVMGFGLLLTYGVVSVTHSFMEPRLVGGQLGLHPVATLMAMYLGYRTVGVLGMITFPFLLLLLKQFHDQGHIRLWK